MAEEIKREGDARGAMPTSLAAFPAGTAERTVFWKAGFRIDMQHTVMRYVGEGDNGDGDGSNGRGDDGAWAWACSRWRASGCWYCC